MIIGGFGNPQVACQTGSFAMDAVHESGDVMTVLILLVVTMITNGLLSILIAARLIYAHRTLMVAQSDSLGGSHQRRPGPYLTALAICVESSAIIFVTAVLSLMAFYISPALLFFSDPEQLFQPVILMTQLCVSSYSFQLVTLLSDQYCL